MSLRHRLRFQHRRFRRQWVPLVAEMTVGRVLTKIRGRQSHTERDSEGEQVERAVGRASCDEELRRGWQSVSGGEGRWPGRAGRSESARSDWEAPITVISAESAGFHSGHPRVVSQVIFGV